MVRVLPAVLSATFSVAAVQARTFLRACLTSGEAERSLNMELRYKGTERMAEFMGVLRPTYTALPKNAEGLLELKAARYALHRMFVSRHNWNVKGLSPSGSSTDWVPGFMLESLEKQGNGRGFDLESLAALSAALEDLTVEEAYDRLEAAMQARNLPSEHMNRQEVETALTTYLIVYLVGGNFTFDSVAEIVAKEEVFAVQFAGWEEHKAWLKEMLETMLGEPAPGQTFDMETTRKVAVEVGAKFGSFNVQECSHLKNELLQLSPRSRKAGRVRLADFYHIGLHTHWYLNEKVEYLNALGALDLSNVSNPLVIIPNYLVSQSNCMSASELYSVCCPNECEDLLLRLETEVAEPSARPARVAEIVSTISSQTVEAPRKLLQSQIDRLYEIADSSATGEVSLHGRLFAQWMHHAFPNECPFPHAVPTAAPAESEEQRSSEEELRKIVEADVCSGEEASSSEFYDLPWSQLEESFVSSAALVDDEEAVALARIGAMFGMIICMLLVVTSTKARSPTALKKLAEEYGLRWQLVAALALTIFGFAMGLVDLKFFVGGGVVVFAVQVQALLLKSCKRELPSAM